MGLCIVGAVSGLLNGVGGLLGYPLEVSDSLSSKLPVLSEPISNKVMVKANRDALLNSVFHGLW